MNKYLSISHKAMHLLALYHASLSCILVIVSNR